MGHYRIALLPGDGIGPEVLQATAAVLETLTARFPGINLSLESYAAGAEHYRLEGVALPDEVLEACLAADAVLLAAIGFPDVRRPDGTEVQPEMMVGLRRALHLHSAARPIKLYSGVPTPLRDTREGIDFVIVRENIEGLFASFGGGSIVRDDVATDTLVITRDGTRRVAEFAFKLARSRNGRPFDGTRRVTCVDKANVFRSLAFFRRVVFEVAAAHPAIATEATYVDAMSLYMVQCPSMYDVVVTENQFGDILSDLGAALVGGLGLAPSAELGDDHALFQPSHGSAPDLAGKDTANPLAMILSAAMMLDWLGERHGDRSARDASRRLEQAVESALGEGSARTADIGGKASTREAARAVAERI